MPHRPLKVTIDEHQLRKLVEGNEVVVHDDKHKPIQLSLSSMSYVIMRDVIDHSGVKL